MNRNVIILLFAFFLIVLSFLLFRRKKTTKPTPKPTPKPTESKFTPGEYKFNSNLPAANIQYDNFIIKDYNNKQKNELTIVFGGKEYTLKTGDISEKDRDIGNDSFINFSKYDKQALLIPSEVDMEKITKIQEELAKKVQSIGNANYTEEQKNAEIDAAVKEANDAIRKLKLLLVGIFISEDNELIMVKIEQDYHFKIIELQPGMKFPAVAAYSHFTETGYFSRTGKAADKVVSGRFSRIEGVESYPKELSIDTMNSVTILNPITVKLDGKEYKGKISNYILNMDNLLKGIYPWIATFDDMPNTVLAISGSLDKILLIDTLDKSGNTFAKYKRD